MNTLQKKKTDFERGQESEAFMQPYIRYCLNEYTIKRHPNPWSTFDYYNKEKTMRVELKTRFGVSVNAFPDTIVPYSKIIKCKNSKIVTWFFFRYPCDIVKYIKYDKELFDTFIIDVGGRQDRGTPEHELYVYIPLEKCETFYVNEEDEEDIEDIDDEEN